MKDKITREYAAKVTLIYFLNNTIIILFISLCFIFQLREERLANYENMSEEERGSIYNTFVSRHDVNR